jgi:glycosyltransferase involved in cell wall biosynthesis
MRILLFSNWVPPIASGSSYYAANLVRALAARRHEIVVATLDWGPDKPPPSGLPVPVHALPVMKVPALPLFYNLKLMGFAFTPGNRRRLVDLIQRNQIEILHHVNHIFDTTFLSVSAARATGIPIVGSITTPIQHQNPMKQWMMSLADRVTVGQFGVRHWDGIVSLDRQVHQYVRDVYGEKTQRRSVVIPFGPTQETLSRYHEPLSGRSPEPQILMVGHIHPFRNPIQLVRAMPLVLKAVPNARLILAGRVDLQTPVEEARRLGLRQSQVCFLGAVPHDQIIRLMKESHVFASWVTGRYMSLGTAPMEAMLCQTPVVNDISEDVFGEGKLKNGQNIVLVNSRDPRSIADAIVPILQNDELRQRIGMAGRRFVLEDLSWDNIAGEMEKFYERVMGGHPKAEHPQNYASGRLVS